MRRVLFIALSIITLLAATAIPAAADNLPGPSYPALWARSTLTGSPGAVVRLTTRGAEGGICGDPRGDPAAATRCTAASVAAGLSATPSTQDQIFIDKYQASTTSYAGRQTISSTAYLYYWDGTAWHLYKSKGEGTCKNLTGGGVGGCGPFGSSASDVCNCNYDGTATSDGKPAFDSLQVSWSWTVKVRVTWKNYSTGALLARADYFPTSSDTDIGCAPYAHTYYTGSRCDGPMNAYSYNLKTPSGTIGYISMKGVA